MALTFTGVIVAVVLLPLTQYAGVVLLCRVSQSAGELVLVIFFARDESITVFVAIRFTFVALVVGATHGDLV